MARSYNLITLDLDLVLFLHYLRLGVYKNMTYNMYTIYDKVSKECGPVFQAKNFGVAKRYVEDMVKNNPIKLDEYALYQIGCFDNESFKFTSLAILSWDFSEIFGDTVESVEEVKE